MTQDEAEAAFDAISGVVDGDWSTCAEFLQDPGLAAHGTPSRPSTLPPTMPTRPPTDNDSDGALGLTTTLAAAVAVAVAF